LNAVIGEEKLVAVSFKEGSEEITVRGPKEEVERVRKELERIAEDAKNEEIVNSFVRFFLSLPFLPLSFLFPSY
jgi:hypothetical protein